MAEKPILLFGYCRNCRYWSGWKDRTKWGYCQLTRTTGNQPAKVTSLSQAVGNGDSAQLRTNEAFGCNQWEAQSDKMRQLIEEMI